MLQDVKSERYIIRKRYLKRAFCYFHITILIILLSSILNNTFPQQTNQDYILTHYTNKNGLANESVTHLSLGQDGFLWILNNMQIVRFDGQNFKPITLESKSRVVSIESSATNDSLFVQNSNNDVYIIKDGRVIEKNNLQILKNCISSTNQILSYPDSVTLSLIFTTLKDKFNTNLHKQNIFLTSQKNYFINDRYTSKVYYIANKNRNEILTSSTYTPFRVLINDTLYLLTSKGDFERFYKKKRLPLLTKEKTGISSFLTKYLRYLNTSNETIFFPVPLKQQFLFYQNKSLYELSYRNEQFHITEIFSQLPEIKDVSSITYHDKLNTYFIASLSTGIYSIKKNYFSTLKTNHGIDRENNIMALSFTNGDTILSGRGILLYPNGKSKILNQLRIEPYAIGKDKDGFLYYCASEQKMNGAETHDIYKINASLTQKKRLIIKDSFQHVTKWFAKDLSGNLYAARSMGIYAIKKDTVSIFIKSNPLLKPEFSTNCFAWLDTENVLIGTESCLLSYNLVNKKSDTLLRKSFIRNIYIDRQGYGWISTYGSGHYIISPDNKKTLIKVPGDRGNSSDYIHNFIEDSNGYIWSSSNNGLLKYKIKDVYNFLKDSTSRVNYIKYDYNDGFYSDEFNGGVCTSHLTSDDSAVFLSSINGIVKFYPKKIPARHNNKIFLDAVYADEMLVNLSNPISFPNNVTNIKFLFSHSTIGSSNHFLKEYQVIGLSDKWFPLDNKNEISLNGLPHGDYKINCRVATETGYETLTVAFSVQPKFYETIFFRLFVILTLIILFYLLLKLRTKRLQKISAQLEKGIKEKTASLNATVEELTISKKNLTESYQTIEKVTEIILHDLRSPLKFLSIIASDLDENLRATKMDEVEKKIKIFHKTSTTVYHFTKNLLDWLTNNNKEISSRKIETDLTKAVSDIVDIYSTMTSLNNNQIIFNPEEKIIIETNINIVTIILRNAIDNANKYTINGKIIISIFHSQDTVCIKVNDNGKGFDSVKLMESIANNSVNFKDTLGIRIIHELSKKIGVTYTFDSTPNHGTTFCLYIPTRNSI